MSILLDALRKSEEQRRLGSTPSIHGGPERGPAGGDAAQQWIPLSLIALSAIAMAWIGWQQYQQPPGSAASAASARIEPAASGAGGSDVAEESPGVGPAVRRPTTVPARRTPVETFTESEQTPRAHPDLESAQASLADARKSQVSKSFQDFEADGEPTEASQPRGAPRTDADAPDIEPAPPPEERLAAEPEDAARHRTEPITFWELPQGVRDSLPELRITVLVYADRPEDRFLLVSGQRLVEKDEYTGGVVLDEIRRDGAVFLFRNYRFLVKG